MVIFYQGRVASRRYWFVEARTGDSFGRVRCSMVMSEIPEVVVEHCNGVEEEADANDVAQQNGDDG